MIFHEYKAIFIHIPKAGGSSIENFLWPNIQSRGIDSLWMGFVKPHYNKYQTGGLQHLLAKQVQAEVGDTVFSSYYKFSISRNPWDKAVSQFCFMQRRKDLRDFVGMDERDTFEKYLELIQKKEHVQWKNQLDFILDICTSGFGFLWKMALAVPHCFMLDFADFGFLIIGFILAVFSPRGVQASMLHFLTIVRLLTQSHIVAFSLR